LSLKALADELASAPG